MLLPTLFYLACALVEYGYGSVTQLVQSGREMGKGCLPQMPGDIRTSGSRA